MIVRSLMTNVEFRCGLPTLTTIGKIYNYLTKLWRHHVPAKVYRNKFLNVCGAQVLRVVFAHWVFHEIRKLVFNIRSRNLSEDVMSYVEELESSGIVIIPNFLPTDIFNRICFEYNHALENPDATAETKRYIRRGSTTIEAISVPANGKYDENYQNIVEHFLESKFILNLFSAAERRIDSEPPYAELTKVYRDEGRKELDSESLLHQDHFYPTFKAWLYIDKVDVNNGAFVYVPRLHKLTLKRVVFEYKRSIIDTGGSWRLNEKDKKVLNAVSATSINCDPNTLVLANTYGFHSRGVFKNGRVRKAIFCERRRNPWLLF